MKKQTLIIITIIAVSFLVNKYLPQLKPSTSERYNQPKNEYIQKNEEYEIIEDTSDPNSEERLVLEVPFTSQAPHANWDDPYQEACEEASFLMAYDYLQGVKSYTKAEADRKILDMIKYQEEVGYTKDISISELQTIAKDHYQIDSLILEGESINITTFNKFLNAGSPIIIPAAGQKLGNPNFSGDGPPYHMLVIIGYDNTKQTFITHDPGTRNGANYEYSYDTLLSAIHDWTGSKETIQEGTPRALILK